MIKVCRQCRVGQPLSAFYEHAEMADGHLNICKECVKARVRKHRRENDHVREYDLRRHRENPRRREKAKVILNRWRRNTPGADSAHCHVTRAIRDGRLTREPCVVCGTCNRLHAHHEDYAKPLDVIWLCVRHHRLHHAKAIDLNIFFEMNGLERRV